MSRDVRAVQILAEGHDVFSRAPAQAHGRSDHIAKLKQKGFSAIFTSCAAGLALTAQGMLLIARLAKFMVAFAFVRGGTRGKLAAWDERQEELMTWFKVCAVVEVVMCMDEFWDLFVVVAAQSS